MPNILHNPSFEDIPDLYKWNKVGVAANIHKSPIVAWDGSYSLRQEIPTSSYSGREVESDPYPAIAGIEYYINGYFYIRDSGAGDPSKSQTHTRLRMRFYDAGMSHIGYGYWNPSYPDWGWTTVTTWDTWLEYSPLGTPGFSFVAPAGTAYISVVLESRYDSSFPNPNNDVFWDYILLEGLVPFSSDDWRIRGYIVGPMPSSYNRVVGNLGEAASSNTYLIKGEIDYIWQYLDEPDEGFMEEEDKLCNRPRSKILFFHDDLPAQSVPAGKDGEYHYIDITDRIISCGNISRDIPSEPGHISKLVVSDLMINVDNSDYYFSDRNDDSPFKTILDAGGDYIGWMDGGRLEVWCGFLRYNNVIKLIQKAKMVIVNIQTDSNAGVATISLRDYVTTILDKQVGLPVAESVPAVGAIDLGGERPLEYPTKPFSAISPAFTNYLEFRTNLTPDWRKVYIPDGNWGKHTRAILMQGAMNQPWADGGLVMGMAATGASSDESFTFTFDEETQKYTISGSGIDWLVMRTNTGVGCQSRWGWPGDGLTIYGNGTDETELESVVPLADSVNFTWLLLELIEQVGGYKPAVGSWCDIESLPGINFNNVRWDEKTLLDCIADVVVAGSGVMWMDDEGTIYFRTYEGMDYSATKTLEGNKNYIKMEYVGRDADRKIRKLTTTGRREDLVGEKDTGLLVGSEINISAYVIDENTPNLAQTVTDDNFRRFNVIPSKMDITAAYLPSLNVADTLRLLEPSNPKPLRGQVLRYGLDPHRFQTTISLLPLVESYTWNLKEEWDDFYAEDGLLYVPWDMDYLQPSLLNAGPGYREYVYDAGAGLAATWVSLDYDADLSHKTFFLDHFDYDPSGRYTLFNFPDASLLGAFSWMNSDTPWVRMDARNADCSVFARIDNILDGTPSRYINYKIWGAYRIQEIFDWSEGEEWTAQAAKHFHGFVMRMRDYMSFWYSFIKARGGYSSPRVGFYNSGINNYRNTAQPRAYGPLGEWHTHYLEFAGGVDPGANVQQTVTDLTQTELCNGQIGGLTSWPWQAMAGFGFARCLGDMLNIHLTSEEAPDAEAPVFSYWTGATPTGPWTSHGSTFPQGVSTRCIRIRVSLSRGDEYSTIPWLKSMTLSFNK